MPKSPAAICCREDVDRLLELPLIVATQAVEELHEALDFDNAFRLVSVRLQAAKHARDTKSVKKLSVLRAAFVAREKTLTA